MDKRICPMCAIRELSIGQSICGDCQQVIMLGERGVSERYEEPFSNKTKSKRKTKSKLRSEARKRYKDVDTRRKRTRECFEMDMIIINSAAGKIPEDLQKLRIESPVSGKLVWIYRRPNSKNLKRKNDIVKFFLLLQQENKCAICGKVLDGCAVSPDPDIVHLDHNHETGEVRGVLCSNCNQGLGQFRDNIDYLQNAISYLEGWE